MGKYFGTKLPSGNRIPYILSKVVDFFNCTGLGVEGIFRISGNRSEIEKLKKALDKGKNVDINNEQPHVVAGLLKLYLRELTEPLLTFDAYNQFLSISDVYSEQGINEIKEILSVLPSNHRITLKFLMNFLFRVASYSSINKMKAENLAIVFAPCLLKSKDNANISQNSSSVTLIESMITNCKGIFTDEPNPEDEIQVLSTWSHTKRPSKDDLACKFDEELENLKASRSYTVSSHPNSLSATSTSSANLRNNNNFDVEDRGRRRSGSDPVIMRPVLQNGKEVSPLSSLSSSSFIPRKLELRKGVLFKSSPLQISSDNLSPSK